MNPGTIRRTLGPVLVLAAPGVLLTAGLIAGSSVAWAQTNEDDEPEANQSLIDTLFNFGYDVVNQVFL